MTNNLPRIAVLDDEVKMRKALSRLLRTHGFDVETYSNGEDFLGAVSLESPHCLVLDLHMPGMTGFDVLKAFVDRNIKLPVVVITGHDEANNANRVHALGASAYLTKPIDESSLLAAIARATSELLAGDGGGRPEPG
jgi:two-component system, LuxR family, response regulator FixJ